jgi:Domain of unknown function (DUF4166)
MEQALDRTEGRRLRERAGSRVPDFVELLGRDAWQRLPAAVRARFAPHDLARPYEVLYEGRMHVRASWLGRCLARLCRLMGTPVAPFVHENVPVSVKVFDNATRTGTVWERCYHFPGRDPVTVSSTKQVEADGTLVEALGAGLRMRLRVFEHRGELHFLSTGYYFQLGELCIDLPAWMLPGPTLVTHADLGDGTFLFTMHTAHRRWGDMYEQGGRFAASVQGELP